MPLQSYEELLLWNPPPQRSIVGFGILLQHTKLLMYGGPKAFKSLLAQQLAFCISTNQDWLGIPVTQGKVLYIQAEISRVPFRGRVMSCP